MDFELSDEQRILRDAARKLLDDAAPPSRVREVMGAPEGYDRELWSAMAAQGWPALEVPEADGGLGFGFVELAVLVEQIGRHVAPAPYLSTALAQWAIRVGAAEGGAAAEVASEWVEALATGEAIGCVAWNGGAVVDAPVADVAVVARLGKVRVFDLRQARPAAEVGMDETRSIGWLDTDRLEGTTIGGSELEELVLDRAATAYAVEMLGAADRMLEVSVDYAKTREQFDRPIGSFQAVKHRLADMLVDVEGMRSAAYYAAWAQATGADDSALAASTAKSWCSDASRRVLASALQVHGGIGFTWEHDLHLFLKRVHLDQHVFGTAPFHRERIARILRERIEAGLDLW